MRFNIGRLLRTGHRYGSSNITGKNITRNRFPKIILFSSGMAGGILISKQFGPANYAEKSTLSLNAMDDPSYADTLDERAAIGQIINVVGEDNVSGEKDLTSMHAVTSLQSRQPRKGEIPQFVVYPCSTEEVSKILSICHQYRVPVTAFSGGTSLEGQITPVYGGISLDLSRMDKLIEVHKNDLDVVVQPAIGWQDLNEQLSPYNLFFGPDPGPGAQIGGMVGTACSGTNAFRYGTMRQNVVNLTVVLADGTIIKTRRRPRKSSAGYSLTELFVGAEGTLGIVTEATLRVNPVPTVVRVGLLTFESAKEASDTVEKILQKGIILDAIEFLDQNTMKNINQSEMTARRWNEKYTLLLRFAGSSKSSVEGQIKDVKEVSAQNNCLTVEFARSQDETEELWTARKNAALSLFNSAPEGHRFWTTDVAVPISHLTEMIIGSKDHLASLGIREGTIGHVGDGNFHSMLVYDPETQEKQVQEAVSHMIRRALALGGTCTGEHGVGVAKRQYVLEEVGQPTIDAMRRLKQAFDPHFILNPGKIFSISHKNDIIDH